MAPATSRALVLGGGGVTGIGWEVGLLAGLLDAGVDLRDADAVIGTSAGSFVGANYTSGTDWETVVADQARVADREPVVRTDPALYDAWAEAFRSGAGDPVAVGAGFGRVARDVAVTVDPDTRWTVVRSRLRTTRWPTALRVTVTDADTGALELLGPESGLRIETATAASGAVPGIWPSVRSNGREWIDGGMVSAANASLAAGHDRIVVLAPIHQGYAGIPSAQDDVAELSRTAQALLVVPDDTSRAAIGSNPYDPARTRACAEAGRRQGRAVASDVRTIWD